MTDDEEVTVAYFDDIDEAVAFATEGAAAGASVAVHGDDCQAELDGEGCTCEPLMLVVGGKGEV